jgi:hypothetical protein
MRFKTVICSGIEQQESAIHRFICTIAVVLAGASMALGQSAIPATAWQIPIGTPPANPGSPHPDLGYPIIEEHPSQPFARRRQTLAALCSASFF